MSTLTTSDISRLLRESNLEEAERATGRGALTTAQINNFMQEIPGGGAPTMGERVDYGISSAVRGLGQMGASIPKGAASLSTALFNARWGTQFPAQNSPVYKLGEQAQQYIDDAIPHDRRMQGEFWNETVPEGFGSMAGFMAGGGAGVMLKAPAALAPLLMGAAMEAGSQYDQAVAAGAPEADAQFASVLGGLVGTTEAIPVGHLFTRINRASGGVFASRLAKVVRDGAVQSFEEAIQETFQGTAGNTIAREIYDSDREYLDSVAQQGGAGGVIGFVTGTLVSAATGARVRRGRPIEPSPADRAVAPPQAPPTGTSGETIAPQATPEAPKPAPQSAPRTQAPAANIPKAALLTEEGASQAVKQGLLPDPRSYVAKENPSATDLQRDIGVARGKGEKWSRADRVALRDLLRRQPALMDATKVEQEIKATRSSTEVARKWLETGKDAGGQELTAERRQKVEQNLARFEARLQELEAVNASQVRGDQGLAGREGMVAQTGQGLRGGDLQQNAQVQRAEAEQQAPQQAQEEEAESQNFAKRGLPPEPATQVPVTLTQGEKPATPWEVIAAIKREFKVPMRLGGVHGKNVLGTYTRTVGAKPAPRVARLRESAAEKYDVALHEVAHHIDRVVRKKGKRYRQGVLGGQVPSGVIGELASLDYDQTKRRPLEGFAEFVRIEMSQGKQAAATKAPAFSQWWNNTFLPSHPNIAKPYSNVMRMAMTVPAGNASQRVRDWRSTTGKPVEARTVTERIKDGIHKLARHWWDDQNALKRMRDEAAVIKSLDPGQDPYKYAQVYTHAASAMARDAIENGVFSPITHGRYGVGIIDAIRKLGNISQDEFEQWVDFLSARHAIEMHQLGKNPGVSLADAQAVYQMYSGNLGWTEAADGITDFHKGLVAMLAEVGRLDPQKAMRIIELFPNYVPFMRVMGDRTRSSGGTGKGIAAQAQPVKRMSKEGSGRQIIDPLVSTMKMAEQFYRAASQVIVVRKIADLANTTEGMGKWAIRIRPPQEAITTTLEKLKSSLEEAGIDLADADLDALVSFFRATQFYSGDKPYVVHYRGGKPEWYELDPDLYATITSLDPVVLPRAIEATFGMATKLKRLGATELRPSFGLYMNAIRDMFDYGRRTQGFSPSAPLRELGAAFYQIRDGIVSAMGSGRRDPVIALFDKYGGGLSGFIGQDMGALYKTSRDMLREAKLGRGRMTLAHPINMLRAIFSVAEKSPRIAEFEMILKKHGYSRTMLESGEGPPVAVVMESLHAAQAVTINFKQAGQYGRILNKVSAYTNAGIQGMVTEARAWRSSPTRMLVRSLAWLTIPALLYWWKVKDEDWYKELPEWQRFTGFNFRISDKTLYLPTPYLPAMLFAHLPVAMMDSIYKTRPGAMKEWWETLWEQNAPDLSTAMPDLLEPAVEVAVDRSFWTGKSIVGEDLAHLKPADQYREWNTRASKYVGYLLNLSPAKLDHLIYGYTGGLGTDILKIPEEGPMRAIGTRRILRETTRTNSVDKFYDEFSNVSAEYGSAKKAGKLNADLDSRMAVMDAYRGLISEMRLAAEPETDRRKKWETSGRYITGLARHALGLPELKDYPNPLTSRPLPSEIQKIVGKFITTKRATSRERATTEKSKASRRRAWAILKDIGTR